jgi:hypothetical protein
MIAQRGRLRMDELKRSHPAPALAALQENRFRLTGLAPPTAARRLVAPSNRAGHGIARAQPRSNADGNGDALHGGLLMKKTTFAPRLGSELVPLLFGHASR